MFSTVQGDRVTLDAVVVDTDGSVTWPDPGAFVTFRLELPESVWMSAALARMLHEWAETDSMVSASVIAGGRHPIVRLDRARTVISLPLVTSVSQS